MNCKAVDWKSIVFSETWWNRFRALAGRRFGHDNLAEEAVTAALEAMSRDDWSVFQRFDGLAKPETFLVAVFNHAIEDFSRARFGRPRPPRWLQSLGKTWTRLYTMLCLERRPPESIQDHLCGKDQGPDEDELKTMISQIRGRIPDCGAKRMDVSTSHDAEHLQEQQAYGAVSGASPEKYWEQHDFLNLLGTLQRLMGNDTAATNNDCFPQSAALMAVAQEIELDDHERLLLRMVFQDSMSVSLVARALNERDHTVRRRLKAVLERIRTALGRAGLSAADLMAAVSEELP